MKSLSRLATILSQSSRRPPMRVTTGPMVETSLPSASRRLRPRSMASPVATAWGTEKETVTLTDTPR